MKRYYKGSSAVSPTYPQVTASDDFEIEASYWYYGGDQPYLLVCKSDGWVVYDNYHNKVAGPYDSWAYAEDWCDSTNGDYSN